MKIKKISIFIVLFLLVSVYASAIPTIKYAPVDDEIDVNDNTAIYQLTISNPEKYEQKYQLYTISAFWDVDPSIIAVAGDSMSVTDVDIRLNEDQLAGPQLVPVTIKEIGTSYTAIENLYVYIKPQNFVGQSYVPNVAAKVNMKDQIDPEIHFL